MDQEQCLNKLQYVMEVLDKIHRGYDYITEDGKVNDFTDAEKDEMVKKATVALSEVAFYINGGCKVDRSDIRTVNLWHYPTLRKDNRHWPTFRENELPEPKYGMEVDCLVVRRSTNKSISTLHYVIDKFDCWVDISSAHRWNMYTAGAILNSYHHYIRFSTRNRQ